MTEKRILVTGGAGYIGSHTTIELLNEGFDVTIADDLSNSEYAIIKKIEKISSRELDFVKVDLKDRQAIEQLFDSRKFDAIVHFAASKSVGESVSNPLLYYRNNLLSLMNLLEVMDQFGTNNIVFSSSCTVYGQPDVLPVRESTPIKPAESPYGNTKKIGEDILRDTARANKNIRAISLRYFNPIGAHHSGLIGEKPRGIPNNLMPYLLQVVSGQREKLEIFGNDYDTPDGTAIRDYIHVVDLAKAHVTALHRQLNEQQKDGYEYFNLGSGNGFSVLEIVQTFEKVNGIEVNYEMAPRRNGDIEKIYADNTHTESTLGWKPKLQLDEMMATAWKWQQNMIDGK